MNNNTNTNTNTNTAETAARNAENEGFHAFSIRIYQETNTTNTQQQAGQQHHRPCGALD